MKTTVDVVSTIENEPKRRSGISLFFVRLFKEKPLGTLGAFIVLVLLVIAAISDQIAPFAYDELHMFDKLEAPGGAYLLGTDHLGRDVYSRILYGARISLYVGLGASAVAVVIGTLIGIPSGYLLGKYDLVLQRFCDAVMAFPGLILLIRSRAFVSTSLPLSPQAFNSSSINSINFFSLFASIAFSNLLNAAQD